MKARVVAEHLRPQLRQYSVPSQQQNKGSCHNNIKAIRTWVTKTQERTGITNKYNILAEMTLTTMDDTALVTEYTRVLH